MVLKKYKADVTQLKTCTGCKIEKENNEFYPSKRTNDGLASRCKSCANIDSAKSRKKNIKHYNRVQSIRMDKNADKFREWKATQKCKFCGEQEAVCLDLHHLDPTQKDASLSNVVRSWSWKKLMLEVDKCIVVCSNCHRKIHSGIIIV